MQKQRQIQEEQTRQFREFLFSKQQQQVKKNENAPSPHSASDSPIQNNDNHVMQMNMSSPQEKAIIELEGRNRSSSFLSSGVGVQELQEEHTSVEIVNDDDYIEKI